MIHISQLGPEVYLCHGHIYVYMRDRQSSIMIALFPASPYTSHLPPIFPVFAASQILCYKACAKLLLCVCRDRNIEVILWVGNLDMACSLHLRMTGCSQYRTYSSSPKQRNADAW